MGFNVKMNILDGKIAVTPPTIWYPNSQYFASMPNSKSGIKDYASLMQGVLQKFPFQPKMPGFHPALRINFQQLKMARGSLFRYRMKRIEEQFYQLQKESSRFKDMEFRKMARRLFHMLENELHAQRQLEAREKKYFK